MLSAAVPQSARFLRAGDGLAVGRADVRTAADFRERSMDAARLLHCSTGGALMALWFFSVEPLTATALPSGLPVRICRERKTRSLPVWRAFFCPNREAVKALPRDGRAVMARWCSCPWPRGALAQAASLPSETRTRLVRPSRRGGGPAGAGERAGVAEGAEGWAGQGRWMTHAPL